MKKVVASIQRFRFGELFWQIDELARTANYDLTTLDKMLPAVSSQAQRYYLASLYLQLGNETQAYELLSAAVVASSEMKNYFHVLSYSRKNSLPIPMLSASENRALDYLNKVLQPSRKLSELLSRYSAVSVLGNASGSETLTAISDSCVFCFNHYKKNPRILSNATVHVVTPSYDAMDQVTADHLCITGNSIFHRRSQVWKQFGDAQTCKAIYTLPADLWAELYRQLGGSPTAGLLALGYISQHFAANSFDCLVGGFSRSVPEQNHSYDNAPFSASHNWAAEVMQLEQVLLQLQERCRRVSIQA